VTIFRQELCKNARMDTVLVMMGTFNGARFLGVQLDSIAAQVGVGVHMLVSDDGSTDRTGDILSEYSHRWGRDRFRIIEGPGQGYSENYRHLLLNSAPGYEAYAFSDQDDIWDAGKLQSALLWLREQREDIPALYCGRTRIAGADGRTLGMSPLFAKSPSFRNALVQSIAGGNTMVVNSPARDLLAATSSRVGFVSHDWWAYKMISGAGGIVHYEKVPAISYRQHNTNIIGANSTWRARMVRMFLMASGRFVSWNEQDVAALGKCEDLLDEESRRLLRLFEQIRSGPVCRRLWLLLRSGIHRQTFAGQVSLFLACVMRRI
jgi:glycosyltransferase involved in cell wall biosynthesis